MTEDWRLEAACRGIHPNFFHPEKGDQHTLRTALEICNGTPETEPCPVRNDCLNWILTKYSRDEDLYGIYGGLMPAQRHKLRAAKRAPKRIAVTADRIAPDNTREQALAELLNLVHEVVVDNMVESEKTRLTKWRESNRRIAPDEQ